MGRNTMRNSINNAMRQRNFSEYLKDKQVMRTIKNIDDKVIFNSSSDIDFIEFMRKIAIENEDFNFSILGISDAEEYLEDYCSDLELIDDNEIIY